MAGILDLVRGGGGLFGTPEYSAEDALEVLVDTHLLESTAPGRYRFHDLLRVYAAERAEADLSAAERDAAVGRLLGWYLRTADAAASAVLPHRYDMPLDGAPASHPPLSFSTAEKALRWYDSERANGRRDPPGIGSRPARDRVAAPAPLFIVFHSRGNWADCIATHRIALASARAAGNRQGEAWVLSNLGDALGVTGQSEAIGQLELSLAIRRDIGDRRGEAQAANNLADAYKRLGRMDEALDLLRRALDLNRETGYRYGEGIALGNLGSTLLDLDRAEEAIDYLLQARRIFAEVDYVDGVGYASHILGRCYSSLGRYAEAIDCLRQALTSHMATGNRHQQAATLRSLGTAQNRAGLAVEAGESWAQAAAIYDGLGDRSHAAEVRAEQVKYGI